MAILPQWLSDDGDLTVRGRPRSGASSAGGAESSYNRRMSETASNVSVAPYPRPAILGGLAIAIGGAILFSMKAVVAKLLYRYHIDAVTLIAFRMLFSFPVFAAVALWKMRTEPPLAVRDRWRLASIAQFFVLRPASLLVQPLPVYGLSLVNGIFCTIFPVFMTMAAVQRIGATTASQAGMIGPVSTLFLGWALLGEPITAVQLAGTGLVLGGIYLLSLKK
jgi:drug/metabolite transporter (DMT)-like permease